MVGLLATLLACAPKLGGSSSPVDDTKPRANAPTSEVERLRAFTKLYGYVRFFHPTDAAAAADWDLLAVEGARLALAAEDRVELERALTSWLEPIGRTPHVYVEDEGTSPLVLSEGTRIPNVAWQHLGFGQSLIGFPYESGRLRRAREPTRGRSRFVRVREPLFGPRPKPNEVLDLPLGAGLRVQLPISLPEVFARQSLGQSPDSLAPLPGPEDPAVRAASVIVAWNVLNHFYPYFDVIDEDWDAVLDETLVDVLDDRDVDDLHATLERLVAKLHDGHGYVKPPPSSPPQGQLPLRCARIEGKIIAVAAAPELGIDRGDQILEIDGVDIETRLREAATRTSGSPHYVEMILLGWARVTLGPLGSTMALTLERDGERIELELVRSDPRPPDPVFARPPLKRFDDGVIHVDLARVSDIELHRVIPELASAPGVVFDIRDYPRTGEQLLGHLLVTSVRAPADWMFKPQIIYPDHVISGWDGHHWPLIAAKPHIGGRVAFITGPAAISAAESLLGLVRGYALGEIIGSPTAGANGNIAGFMVPPGFKIQFTGMKVTRLDGGQHHLIGVEPTIPVTPTIAGVLAGRDELLEVALAVARGER